MSTWFEQFEVWDVGSYVVGPFASPAAGLALRTYFRTAGVTPRGGVVTPPEGATVMSRTEWLDFLAAQGKPAKLYATSEAWFIRVPEADGPIGMVRGEVGPYAVTYHASLMDGRTPPLSEAWDDDPDGPGYVSVEDAAEALVTFWLTENGFPQRVPEGPRLAP